MYYAHAPDGILYPQASHEHYKNGDGSKMTTEMIPNLKKARKN